MRAGLLIRVAASFHRMRSAGMSASSGVRPLADIADRERRDGFSQPVIRREDAMVAMPVLPRRRREIGEPDLVPAELIVRSNACHSPNRSVFYEFPSGINHSRGPFPKLFFEPIN